MPLVRIDLIEGRSDDQVAAIMQQVHEAVVACFEVPERDRYQIVSQHRPSNVVLEDTGLGFERTRDAVVISVTSRRRSPASKQAFYRDVTARLGRVAGVKPTDVLISIVENGDADWSFADGEAQFLTGALD